MYDLRHIAHVVRGEQSFDSNLKPTNIKR
jgi:hypothetical protein